MLSFTFLLLQKSNLPDGGQAKKEPRNPRLTGRAGNTARFREVAMLNSCATVACTLVILFLNLLQLFMLQVFVIAGFRSLAGRTTTA